MPATQQASAPARPLLEDLRAIPGADPDHVRRTAFRLAAWLDDTGSAGYYFSVLATVAAASGDPRALQRLLAAFAAGSKAKGSARKPGAVFVWAYANWVAPPRPSEIRYYQTPTAPAQPPPTAGVPAEPPPLERAAEIHELALMANDPKHPFQRVAQVRLAELMGEQGS